MEVPLEDLEVPAQDLRLRAIRRNSSRGGSGADRGGAAPGTTPTAARPTAPRHSLYTPGGCRKLPGHDHHHRRPDPTTTDPRGTPSPGPDLGTVVSRSVTSPAVTPDEPNPGHDAAPPHSPDPSAQVVIFSPPPAEHPRSSPRAKSKSRAHAGSVAFTRLTRMIRPRNRPRLLPGCYPRARVRHLILSCVRPSSNPHATAT